MIADLWHSIKTRLAQFFSPENTRDVPQENITLPELNTRFTITFPNKLTASAIRLKPASDPATVLQAFNFTEPHPAIFISGGASYMSEDDRERVKEIMNSVADFAEEHGAVVIDGGTESGVMQMIGDARLHAGYKFPLIGVAPIGKVSFPGFKNPNEEAVLEDSHSHFVLVEGLNWGDESALIVRLTHAIGSQAKMPAVGILINGGKIAMHEVYLASTKELKLPMLVLEGSGRAADEISTAFRTGKTQRGILQAIMAGGDIQLVSANEGPKAIRDKLAARFSRS